MGNRRNPIASALSIFVGSYENECLMEMQKLLAESGAKPISLVFDGVYFAIHADRSLRDIFPKIRSDIRENFGIDVRAKTLEGEIADLQEKPERVTEIAQPIHRSDFWDHLAL